MNIIQKYKNWKTANNPASITLNRIMGVIQAYWRMLWQKKISKHIIEQFEERCKTANKECILSGTCINCGCSVPDKFWEDAGCICYPPMMSKELWNNWKKIKPTNNVNTI